MDDAPPQIGYYSPSPLVEVLANHRLALTRLEPEVRRLAAAGFSHVQHGNTAEVLRLLDAGTDPHIRDGWQRTLLHLIALLDWATMLPRLLDAGLDLEARDHHQRTPLHVAVGEGPVAVVHALLDAGARTDVHDDEGKSLPDLILFRQRKELRFLYDAVIRDYPNLTRVITYPSQGDWDPEGLGQ